MSTAADITAGVWVRSRHHDRWWFVQRARHTPFSESEPRGSGFVQYDASTWPGSRVTLGGFAVHDEPCRVVTVTPEVAHV